MKVQRELSEFMGKADYFQTNEENLAANFDLELVLKKKYRNRA
jgi:hypothetical protein